MLSNRADLISAGGALVAIDIGAAVDKCSLKPLRRSDYPPTAFTDAQWAQLRSAFAGGVCDRSRPGVDQQATIPWMTYEDTVGGRPLGPPPMSSSG